MADEYNNGFNGFDAGGVFSNYGQEYHDGPAFAVPTDMTASETTTPVAEHVEEKPTEEKPAAKAKKPVPARKPATAELTEKTVRTVLAMADSVDLLDGKVKTIAAQLLGVKNPDDKVKFIIALADDAKSSKAREVVSDLSDLYDLDEMQFAVKVSVREHSDRKYLWEVESKFDEAKAAELGKFPANDVFTEVSMLRKLQKESSSFKQTLDDLAEALG